VAPQPEAEEDGSGQDTAHEVDRDDSRASRGQDETCDAAKHERGTQPVEEQQLPDHRQRDEVDTHDQGDPGDRCLGSVQRAVQDNKPGCDGPDFGHDDKPVAQGETAGRGPVDAGGGGATPRDTTAISTAMKAMTARTRNSTATAAGNYPVLTSTKIKPKLAPITEPNFAHDMGPSLAPRLDRGMADARQALSCESPLRDQGPGHRPHHPLGDAAAISIWCLSTSVETSGAEERALPTSASRRHARDGDAQPSGARGSRCRA